MDGEGAEKMCYDYEVQVWVAAGIVQRCGHAIPMVGCAGCRYHGFHIEDVRSGKVDEFFTDLMLQIMRIWEDMGGFDVERRHSNTMTKERKHKLSTEDALVAFVFTAILAQRIAEYLHELREREETEKERNA